MGVPPGSIDCDVHPVVPNVDALLPYLADHWREAVTQRGIHEFDTYNYPKNSPLTARSDWKSGHAKAASSVDAMREQLLDPFGTSIAICNCLYGVQLLLSEDMADGFTRAVNDWLVREWLEQEPRLRGSIVIPTQNPAMAVAEIERCAVDRRFVQVLMLVSGDMPLGRRFYWPIYEAAEKQGLPIAIHAGSTFRFPVTAVGWSTYFVEDYISQAQAFQTQLTSLICEGVFAKFPDLKMVLTESGCTWLPAHITRLTKFWRGLRLEVPWVTRPPMDVVRSNIRLTLQPFDGPSSSQQVEKVLEHMGSDDILLYSSDYPHWQFDGAEAMPQGVPASLHRKIAIDNPLNTYPRLRELPQ